MSTELMGSEEWAEGISRSVRPRAGNGWIGVDFDGTLAEYHGWEGELVLGPPVPAMVARVQRWLDAGYEVRVVTARAFGEGGSIKPEVVEALDAWTLKYVGRKLPITASKDFGMIELWDDRVVQVMQNLGEPVPGQLSRVEYPKECCGKGPYNG